MNKIQKKKLKELEKKLKVYEKLNTNLSDYSVFALKNQIQGFRLAINLDEYEDKN